MYTFSQLIDDLATELRFPHLSATIPKYLNQTIREIHFSSDRNAAILYKENFKELSVIADSEEAFTWEIPKPTLFQLMAAVKYDNEFDYDGNQIWATETSPGRHLKSIDRYYYRVGGTLVFSGYGGLNSVISLGWYEFPRSLNYYPDDATRPAEYDEDNGWTYPAGAATEEDQALAESQVSNWLLLRWHDVIAEGVRAKVFKAVSDTERARTSYSLYAQLRQGLWTSETARIIEN